MKVDDNNMNIEETSRRMATGHITHTDNSPAGKSRKDSKMLPPGDRLDVSSLARLVSKHAARLSEVHNIRPERIEACRKMLQESADISDEDVDTIFRRMTR